jgi:hypothetical protein
MSSPLQKHYIPWNNGPDKPLLSFGLWQHVLTFYGSCIWLERWMDLALMYLLLFCMAVLPSLTLQSKQVTQLI